MDGFRKVVDYCAFQDLGYCGGDFTWCNMQGGENRIYLRLDRAFANSKWTEKFGGMKAHHLVDSTSDHSALCITFYILPPPPPLLFYSYLFIITTKKCRLI